MKLYYISLITFLMIVLSCSSSKDVRTLSAEERFQIAMKEFESENYLEAFNEFSIITLQFPGSELADDAQFYLGECRFNRKEYLLAAYEYEVIKRNMQASIFVPKAQYKIALCYYHLSPSPSLDQNYTTKAIDEFQTFIEYYSSNELVNDAENKIKELRDRLAEKEYLTAELYMKMEYYKAATFYYNSVLENYHDSKYVETAYVGKIQALQKRKKYDEAKVEADKFYKKFPNSVYHKEIENILK